MSAINYSSPEQSASGRDTLAAIASSVASEGRPLRILVLTQYFPPEMGAPQARLFELASRLRDSGWDVEVLTALPNYPTGAIFKEYRGKRFVQEEVSGLTTVRTWLYPSQSPRALPRFLCYFSFAWSAALLGPRLCQRPDVIFVESPPLFLGVAARYLARIWRVPYVFNVSDLWPESFVALGKLSSGGLTHRFLSGLESWCYRGAAAVTGQSAGIVEYVVRQVSGKRAEIVTNGVDPARFAPDRRDESLRKELGWSGKTVFLYAGLHGFAQGLEQVLEAASRLQACDDLHFAFVGDGPARPRLEELARELGVRNVSFHGAMARDRMPAVLASADAAVITLASEILGAVPSKIYEAMASGLPILLAATGEPAERLLAAGAGVVVPPMSPEALADAARTLACDPELRQRYGASGRSAALTTYNRDRIAEGLNRLLRSVLGDGAPAYSAEVPAENRLP